MERFEIMIETEGMEVAFVVDFASIMYNSFRESYSFQEQ